jgi:Helix-turn-helix domain
VRVTTGQDSAGPAPVAGMTRPAQPQTFILDGPRLRQLRRQRGLSQEELADQAGVSVTTVAPLGTAVVRIVSWLDSGSACSGAR